MEDSMSIRNPAAGEGAQVINQAVRGEERDWGCEKVWRKNTPVCEVSFFCCKPLSLVLAFCTWLSLCGLYARWEVWPVWRCCSSRSSATLEGKWVWCLPLVVRWDHAWLPPSVTVTNGECDYSLLQDSALLQPLPSELGAVAKICQNLLCLWLGTPRWFFMQGSYGSVSSVLYLSEMLPILWPVNSPLFLILPGCRFSLSLSFLLAIWFRLNHIKLPIVDHIWCTRMAIKISWNIGLILNDIILLKEKIVLEPH